MFFRPLQFVIISFLVLSSTISSLHAAENEIGTYDTLHLIPPIYARDGLNSNSLNEHFLYLSTNEATAFDVTIRSEDSSINQVVSIDENNPGKITLSAGVYGATRYGAMNIIGDTGLNIVNRTDGIILTAGKQFYANVRHNSTAQGASLTAKGQTAFGTRFRSGHLISTSAESGQKSSFISVMATEDATAVTFNLPAGVTFVNTPPAGPVTLNQYESYTVGVKVDGAGNSAADGNINGDVSRMANIVFNRLNATLVTSTKPIVMNSGTFLGGSNDGVGGGGRDIGLDQIVPTAYLGTEFFVVKGGGTTNAEFLETPLIIADTDSTDIFLKGSETVIATIDAGEYYVVSGTEYPASGSMFIRTSQPVYLYQNTSSNDGTGNGLNAVAALFNNLEVQSVLIPEVDQLGGATITIIAPVSATISVNAVPIAGAVTVPGKENYVFYIVTGETGDVAVSGTEPFFVTMHTDSGVKGSAGYFVGFPNSYAVRDITTTAPNTLKIIDVQANDVSGPFTFTVTGNTAPSNGSAVLNGDGTITYTPDNGFAGEDTFEYTIDNGAGLTDTTIVTVAIDSDGDGVGDVNDLDSDNDGIPDFIECPTGPPYDNSCVDTDGDTVTDKDDLDSDNDGIFDLVEAGHGQPDADNNGKLDGFDGDNGLADAVETGPESGVINYTVASSDADGIADYLDLDSDADDIPDNIEAQASDVYIAPDATVNSAGINTAYPNGLTTYDTDGDGTPDYMDTDSDNAGGLDSAEKGLIISSVTYADVNGDFAGFTGFTDTDGDLGLAALVEGTPESDVDFRDATVTPDTTKPVITLLGADPQTIFIGAPYVELDATATDNVDSDAVITAAIVIDATTVITAVAGSYNVTYDVNDIAGNPADTVTRAVTVVDNVAPIVVTTSTLIANAANSSAYTVSGSCTDGDGDVTVAISGATPATQPVACLAGGLWSAVFDVTGISDGSNAIIIDASQTDGASNTGIAATVLLDKDVLIATPTVDFLTTNNVTPIISGTAEANSSIVVSVAGASFNTFANGSGVWSIDTSSPDTGIFAPDTNGSNSVTVESSDAAGNLATDATANELIIDTTAPSVPTVNSQETNDVSPVITGSWDNVSAISLSVTVNAVTYQLGSDAELTNSSASWTLDLSTATLAAGTYDVAVSVADAAGNATSDASNNELIIDLTAPAVPTVNSQTTEDTTPVITGTWDAASAANLTVTVNSVTYVLGSDAELTNTGSNWTLDLSAVTLAAGTYGVVVSTADIAGNVSADATANELIIVGSASASDTMISVSAATVIADGLTTSIITVQAIDANGNNLISGGDAVTLASTGNGIISAPVSDNGNGTYTATITDVDTETVIVSGTINAVAITDTVSVSFTDVTAPVITLNDVTPLTIELGGGYFESGASAFDNTDGNLTSQIVMVGTADPDTLGTYTITFDVSDAAGNAAVQVIKTVIVADTTAPGVAILNQPGRVNSLDTFTVAFQFTEIVSGFDISDIVFSNTTASLSNFVNVGGVGDTYTVDITPNGVGDIFIGVNASVAQDPSANNNTAAITQITAFDNTPPDVVVNPLPGINLANQSAYTVSGNCTAGDGDVLVLLSQATLFITPFATCSAGGTWSSTFNLTFLLETDGNSNLNVNVNATQTDSAGNTGTALIVETVKDTVRPNVQIQNAPTIINASEFTIDIVFDEDVTNFDSGDISVINGSVNAASFAMVDAQTYTVGIVPDGVGDITLNIAANVALDLVGNDNNAATPVVITFDNIAPVVTITTADVVNAANDDIYTVAGNCTDGDGVVSVSVAGATPVSQDVNCITGNWTADFDVTSITDGTNVVIIDASQTDTATNVGNATQVQVDKDVVISVPTVNLLVTNNITPVITGTADESSSNEIIIAGATYTVIAIVGDIWSLDTAVDVPDSGTFSLVNGTNDVVVTSTDAAGNTAVDVSVNEVTLTLDDDNDGIPNSVECPSGPPFDNTCIDSDGDGIPDFQETDSDNDGIPDSVEVGVDTNNPIDSDGDGIPDYRDTDSDNDGIDDVLEGVVDTDGDGIPDYVDVGNTNDSDGDGIPDTIECPVYPGCTDTDGDGVPDYLDTDTDNDGIDDAVEAGVDPTAPIDTDGDGIPDFRDTDSDGDGTDDSIEGLTDNDGDGIPDYVDAASAGPAPNAGDSDGDGIADNIECELYPLCADSDLDGTPDYMETDSDNDGISDADETGSAINDADNDGIDDVFDIDLTGGLDLNGDGIDDTQPLDTDGDGTPDYQDMDSDGDGVTDILECPTGVPCPDTDNDGISDQLDASNGDGTGNDLIGAGDSDGDGISDFNECAAGVPCPDVDRDGLPDYMDNNPDDGPVADPDNDLLPNYLDPDDDNDSIPDVVEDPNFDADNNPATNPLDSDFDGTPDYLDLDSDNDDLSDFDESGSSGNDADGDNIDDSYDIDLTAGNDVNSDGIDDDVRPLDTDGDSLPDYLDTVDDTPVIGPGAPGSDTDGDGIADSVECPVFPTDCADSDNDGTPDFLETDSDNDGIDDAVEVGTNPASPIDTDGDGTPDYQDTNSDNDALGDSVEGIVDVDSDGIPDYVDADTSGAAFGGDSDGDGVEDLAECQSYPNCADSDGDGTPDYMDADSRPYDPNAAINTGVNGVGGNGLWTMLLMPLVLLIRRKIIKQ